jgi:hypothetical protein
VGAELDQARRRLVEIRQKYTRPDQQQYLKLLIAAWEYHIRVLQNAQSN